MYTRLLFLVLCIIQFSCDKQSNPFIGDNPAYYVENMMGESRDILILDYMEFDIFDCSKLVYEYEFNNGSKTSEIELFDSLYFCYIRDHCIFFNTFVSS